MNTPTAPVVVALAMITAVAGCGGGGSDSTDGDDTASYYTGSTRPVAATDAASADGALSDFKPFLRSEFSYVGRMAAKTTITEPCPDGGSVTTTEAGTRGQAGYKQNESYKACADYDESGGTVSNGSQTTELLSATDSIDEYSNAYRYSHAALKRADVDSSGALLGSFTLEAGTYEVDSGGNRPDNTLVSEYRTAAFYDSRHDGTTLREVLRRGFVHHTTYDNDTRDLTTSLDGTITATALGGTLVVDTLQPFFFPASSGTPTQGQVVLTLADNVKVRLTVNSGTEVVVDYDLDHDGTFEDPRTTTWDAL